MSQGTSCRTVSGALYQLILKFADEGQPGLLLAAPPTGSGKSHAAKWFISDVISGNTSGTDCGTDPELVLRVTKEIRESDRKIIYMTPENKNQPGIKELSDLTGLSEEEVKKNVLYLPAKDDRIRCFFPSLMDTEKNTHRLQKIAGGSKKEYSALLSCIRDYETARENLKNGLIDQDAFDTKRQRLSKAEEGFRNVVKRELKATFDKTPPEKIARIIEDEDSEWHFVGVLYPAVFLSIRKIYCFSVTKAFYPVDSIIGGNFRFFDKDCPLTNGAIVFIDEFDDAKHWLLNEIIKNKSAGAGSSKIDLVKLFLSIREKVEKAPFSWMTQGDRAALQRRRLEADQIYSDYHLGNLFKTNEGFEAARGGFIFLDCDIMHTMSGAGKNMRIMAAPFDEKTENTIFLSGPNEEKPDANGTYPLYVAIRRIEGFITYFEDIVRSLSLKYKINRPDITTENAVLSILNGFQLEESYVLFLKKRIFDKMYQTKFPGQKTDAPYNMDDLYGRGFSVIALEDGPSHDMQTFVSYFSASQFPELDLLNLCSNAYVVGLSATGTIPAAYNFDLTFLEKELGENFHVPYNARENCHKEVFEKEFREIEHAYYDSLAGYSINGGPVGPLAEMMSSLKGRSEGEVLHLWTALLGDEEKSKSYINEIRFVSGDDKNCFHLSRYYMVCLSYQKFLLDEDISSFLCLVNKIPRAKTYDPFSRDMLNRLFKDIYDQCLPEECGTGRPGGYYFVLDSSGDGYKANSGEMKRRLSSGEKLFVIAAYNTIGSGQNLQFKIPENYAGMLYRVNDLFPCEEKDFDGIFLEKPTHVFERLSDEEVSFGSFAGFLHLAEYLEQTGDISRRQKSCLVEIAVRRYYGNGEKLSAKENTLIGSLENTPGIRLYCTRIIMQALGRISRTGQKIKHPRIFFDEGLLRAMETEIPGIIESPELTALKEGILREKSSLPAKKQKKERQNRQKAQEDHFINNAEIKQDRTARLIRRCIERPWTQDSMHIWRLLREVSLKAPSASSDVFDILSEEEKRIIRQQYIPQKEGGLPYVFYSETEDFKECSISRIQDRDHPMANTPESTRLFLLMQNKIVYQYFADHGYALDFPEDARFVMPPILGRNIYMGALGEQAGKAILDHELSFLGITLEEITNPDDFEVMDFVFSGTNIYADFKNWHRSIKDPDLRWKLIEDTANKAAGIEGCEAAFIINVLQDENDTGDKPEITTGRLLDENGNVTKEIRVYLVPSLLNKNDPSQLNTKAIEFIGERIRRHEQ